MARRHDELAVALARDATTKEMVYVHMHVWQVGHGEPRTEQVCGKCREKLDRAKLHLYAQLPEVHADHRTQVCEGCYAKAQAIS